MALRSHKTRWFEVFVRRDQVIYALEALASTDSVQLELDPRFAGSLDVETLSRTIRDFDQLAKRYRKRLPDPTSEPAQLAGSPDELAGLMLRRLQRWRDRLEPLLARSGELTAQRDRLLVLQEAALAMGDSASQLPQLAHSTDLLFKRLYRCGADLIENAAFENHLEKTFIGKQHCFVVVVGLPGQGDEITDLLTRANCEAVDIPTDLVESPGEQLADICHRLELTHDNLDRTDEQIRLLHHDARVGEALANMETLRWFTRKAHQVSVKDAEFCRITGWTSDTEAKRLETVLNRAQLQAEVHFARPPSGSTEPVTGLAGWWRQPFQFFTAMSGAPSPDEIDPTGLLAIVVPLLFGYMFPDAGHGLIIAIAGLVLSRYRQKARFLINCGLVSVVMGILFDDFFGYELLHLPWQIHALDDPLLVLIIPMYFGVALLLLGMAFNGLEMYWRGQTKRWLLNEAAVLVMYVSLLASLWFGFMLPAAT